MKDGIKAAKSFLGLSLICGKKSQRVLCQIYGRLIVLTLFLFPTKNVGAKAKGTKFFKMFPTFTNLCFLFYELLER